MWWPGTECSPGCDHTFTEGFTYNSPGGITGQNFTVAEPARNYSPGGNISATLTANYTYDNEGRITATQYPSSWNGSSWVAGPNLGNSFDNAGRLQKLTDLAASSDIISGATYGAAGQLLTMTGNGGAPSETRTYNSIGQMIELQSGSLDIQYAYSATQNNGKIVSQKDMTNGEEVDYLYDSLNRLARAETKTDPSVTQWGQSYTYDGFGNLTNVATTKGSTPNLATTYDPATNRQTGECADANGNVNASTPSCGAGYIYDVENRIVAQTSVWLGAQPTVAYSYKPGNKRIWKGISYVYDGTSMSLPTSEELTFWSTSGQKLETYSLTQYQPGGPNTLPQLVATQTGTNYYFGGKLVKNAGGYATADRLGSIGKYFPYGQERPSATTDGKEKFATYFRDSETGLDYAQNRYHQPGMGRFLSPDPYKASAGPEDPGSWNRYAYTGSDPVNRTDPNGLEWCGPNGTIWCDSITVTASGGGGAFFERPIYDPPTGPNDCMVYMNQTGGDISACAGGGLFNPFPAPPPPLPCPAGQMKFSYGCDVPLNGFALQVINLINKNNPGGFVNGAATVVGMDLAVMNAVNALTAWFGSTMTVGDTIVLGKIPTYLNVAQQIGADAFSMSNELWNALSPAERWAANKAFLDAAIAQGSTILFATPASQATGYFLKEIEYLETQGYIITETGAYLVPLTIP